MKIRATVFVLAFILIAQTLFAQTYAFKVLVSKGKTEYKSSADGWQTIKVGSSLKPTDEVKIGENAYLGLIHLTGKPLEVKEARTYKVSDLVSKMAPGTSVLNKYTDFILSSENEKKNRLSATGAVHRDVVLKENLLVYLPKADQSKIYGDHAVIEWSNAKAKGPYHVVLTNLMGEELAKMETTDTYVTLNVNDEKFKRENQIMVKVTSKGGKNPVNSTDYIIKKMKTSERQKIDSLMNQVNVQDEKSALTKYIMAGFYEENMLLIDALTAYQEAAKLAPDVELYKTAHEDFLKRMGFIK